MEPDEYRITIGANGAKYLKVLGRKGWPLKMLDDETPEETLRRYEERRTERVLSDAVPDPITDEQSEDEQPKKRPDPMPRTRPAVTKKDRATTTQLASMIAELLVMPAIPMKMVVNCDYCARHFLETGPRAARELAKMSESNEALRRLLERMYDGWTAITYASVFGTYLMKPAMHHLAPTHVRESVGPFVGVPLNDNDLARKRAEHERHAAAPQAKADAA